MWAAEAAANMAAQDAMVRGLAAVPLSAVR